MSLFMQIGTVFAIAFVVFGVLFILLALIGGRQ